MSDLPSIVGPLLALFAALGLAASAGLHGTVPFLALAIAASLGAVELAPFAEPLGTVPGLALAAMVSLIPTALLTRRGFAVRPGLGLLFAPLAGSLAAFLWLSAMVEGTWLIAGVAGACPVAVLVRLTATRARAVQGDRAPGLASVGPAFGEYISSLLVAAVAIYSSVTVPMLVIALVAGAVHIGRRASRIAPTLDRVPDTEALRS